MNASKSFRTKSIGNFLKLPLTRIMNPIRFRLRAWESWTPDHNPQKTEALPALLRRRVTSLGRQALGSAWGLPETARARLILSSRHGEFSRTLSLLEAVTSRNDLSPADFTLS